MRDALERASSPLSPDNRSLGFLVGREVKDRRERRVSRQDVLSTNNAELLGRLCVLASAEEAPVAIGPSDVQNRQGGCEDMHAYVCLLLHPLRMARAVVPEP